MFVGAPGCPSNNPSKISNGLLTVKGKIVKWNTTRVSVREELVLWVSLFLRGHVLLSAVKHVKVKSELQVVLATIQVRSLTDC